VRVRGDALAVTQAEPEVSESTSVRCSTEIIARFVSSKNIVSAKRSRTSERMPSTAAAGSATDESTATSPIPSPVIGAHAPPFSNTPNIRAPCDSSASPRPASQSGATTWLRMKSPDRPVMKAIGTPAAVIATRSVTMLRMAMVRVTGLAIGPSTSKRSPRLCTLHSPVRDAPPMNSGRMDIRP